MEIISSEKQPTSLSSSESFFRKWIFLSKKGKQGLLLMEAVPWYISLGSLCSDASQMGESLGGRNEKFLKSFLYKLFLFPAHSAEVRPIIKFLPDRSIRPEPEQEEKMDGKTGGM